MPWKLILFILSVVLVTIFIGFNLTNACDVSLGVYTFKNVPIFMSILLAFALGVFVMLPFTFGHSKKEKKSQNPKKSSVDVITNTKSTAPSYSGNTSFVQKQEDNSKITDKV